MHAELTLEGRKQLWNDRINRAYIKRYQGPEFAAEVDRLVAARDADLRRGTPPFVDL